MDKSIQNLLRNGDLSSITTYQAGVMQAATNRILQKHCDDILDKYGITKMQWLIIGTVLDAGDSGMMITDLAKKLDTTLSYLTTTVNLLESKNILTRIDNLEDSRSKYISVNPKFVAKCAVIEQTMRRELRKSVYKQLTPAELRTYMKVLYKLTNLDNR